MKRLFVYCFLLLAPTGIAFAAPLSRDLGQGLAYFRVHQLPADLPTDESARRQPCVLDLRYVSGDAEAGAALAAWLRFHAIAHAPVFVLANPDTSSALLTAIPPHGSGTSVVVLGAAGAGFTPDIALKISPDAERYAYDALEHDVAIDSLITEKPDKPRNDEAQLAKERQPDATAGEDSTAAAAPAARVNNPIKPKPQPPQIDVVLQRAVQLHRALLALKKI